MLADASIHVNIHLSVLSGTSPTLQHTPAHSPVFTWVRISRRCAILRHMKQPSVYILASKRDGVLYIGVTSDLWQRMA
ncbi:MAG: hypothetical protein ACR2O4_00685, partial [Hyphomicrobiaceae bacterium]